MKPGIFLMFWGLITLAFRLGDGLAILLTLMGFLIMMYYIDELDDKDE